MENLSFVLWICLFPLATTVNSILWRKYIVKEEYPEWARATANTIELIAWIWIACFLYVPI